MTFLRLMVAAAFALVAAGFPAATVASDVKDALVLTATDGHRTIYPLAEEPRVTFAGELLVISTPDYSIEVPLAEVDNISYEATGGIDSPSAPDGVPFTITDDNTLIFTGLSSDATVTVHSSDGRLMARLKVSAEGRASVSLNGLVAGAYIVTVNSSSYKIAVK